MKAKTLSLFVFTLLGAAPSFAAPISFQQAWDLLQQSNNSLAAGRANVERYQHIENSTDSLNLPAVSIGANYTRLDQDVTLSGKQIFDSTGQSIPSSLEPVLGPILASAGSITSTITERDIFSSSIRAIWPIFTGGRISAAQA
ncbi:TolC family protein, partial [Vibrio anguillarum]